MLSSGGYCHRWSSSGIRGGLGTKNTIFWVVGCSTTVYTRPSGYRAGALEKHSSHKSVSRTSHLSEGSDAARVRKRISYNSTKLLVGNGYLLKLLFSGKQPVVVRELGHGQLKWLGRYSMPPSML